MVSPAKRGDYDSDSFSDHEENQPETSHAARKSPSESRKKAKRARRVSSCENCIIKKLKCDKRLECGPCKMRSIPCVWLRAEPSVEEDDEAVQLAVANKEIHRLRSVVEELNQTIEELKISQSRTPSTRGSSTRSQPRSSTKSEIDSPLPRSKTLFDVEEGGAVRGEVLGGPMVGTPFGSPAYVDERGLQLDHGPLLSPDSARQPMSDTSYFQPADPLAPRAARYLSYPTPPPAAVLEMYPHFLEHTPTSAYSFAAQQQLPPVVIPTCPPVPKYEEAAQTFPLRHHSQAHLSTPYDYPMPTQPDPVSFKYLQHAQTLPTPLPSQFPPSATAARFSSHPSIPPLSTYAPFASIDTAVQPVQVEEERMVKRRPLSLTTFAAAPKLRRTLSDSYLVSPVTPSYVVGSPGRNLAD